MNNEMISAMFHPNLGIYWINKSRLTIKDCYSISQPGLFLHVIQHVNLSPLMASDRNLDNNGKLKYARTYGKMICRLISMCGDDPSGYEETALSNRIMEIVSNHLTYIFENLVATHPDDHAIVKRLIDELTVSALLVTHYPMCRERLLTLRERLLPGSDTISNIPFPGPGHIRDGLQAQLMMYFFLRLAEGNGEPVSQILSMADAEYTTDRITMDLRRRCLTFLFLQFIIPVNIFQDTSSRRPVDRMSNLYLLSAAVLYRDTEVIFKILNAMCDVLSSNYGSNYDKRLHLDYDPEFRRAISQSLKVALHLGDIDVLNRMLKYEFYDVHKKVTIAPYKEYLQDVVEAARKYGRPGYTASFAINNYITDSVWSYVTMPSGKWLFDKIYDIGGVALSVKQYYKFATGCRDVIDLQWMEDCLFVLCCRTNDDFTDGLIEHILEKLVDKIWISYSVAHPDEVENMSEDGTIAFKGRIRATVVREGIVSNYIHFHSYPTFNKITYLCECGGKLDTPRLEGLLKYRPECGLILAEFGPLYRISTDYNYFLYVYSTMYY